MTINTGLRVINISHDFTSLVNAELICVILSCIVSINDNPDMIMIIIMIPVIIPSVRLLTMISPSQ
jgi:hypothetical protein